MKLNFTETYFGKLPRFFKHGMSGTGSIAAAVAVLGLGAALASGQDGGYSEDEGVQVLTRGPVHEAFAEMVSYNPEPGVIVRKAPPADINELPPEVRPDGDNVAWIPGYWGWDDERDDHLWISGTWRNLPPGRQWTTGYWGESGQGHQWISGYWAEATTRETTYLPRPPMTVESGPNIPAPSDEYGWTPGSWMWQQERYAWSPGYWAEGRPDWDWVPARHVWTPRGYVFVNGYWDYSFERRGVLYAPVHFQPGYRSRPDYSYSPVIAIGLSTIIEHMFLRPTYRHYYFGDYYNRTYRDNGYYSPYAYQSARRGHDPIYSHRRWTHRDDRDWERNYQSAYEYRRDNESARPPRTWADQMRIKRGSAEADERQFIIAAPFQEMAKRKDSPMRVREVSEKERQEFKETSREVVKIRGQRREIEKEGYGKAEEEIKPTKAAQLPSPIVGKPPKGFNKEQAPPEPPRDPDVESEKAKPTREPAQDKNKPEGKGKQEPSETEKRKEAPDQKREEAPRPEKEQPPARREAEPESKKQEPEPERRMEKPKKDSQPEPERRKEKPQKEAEPERRQPPKPAEEGKPKRSDKGKEREQEPPAERQPAPDKEVSEKSSGKSQKKERK